MTSCTFWCRAVWRMTEKWKRYRWSFRTILSCSSFLLYRKLLLEQISILLILKLNDSAILLHLFLLSSQKNHRYSRLYLNFKHPEDVVEFAEVFNGHVFVNEKGIFFILLLPNMFELLNSLYLIYILGYLISIWSYYFKPISSNYLI